MYRRNSASWIKHIDFILLDLLTLQMSYVLAVLFTGSNSPYGTSLYRTIAVMLEIADVTVILLGETYKNVLKRGYYKEMVSVVKQTVSLAAIIFFYLFLTKQGSAFSRAALFTTFFVFALFAFLVRVFWKKHLKSKIDAGKYEKSLFIITDYSIASQVVREIRDNNYSGYRIAGLGIADRFAIGEEIEGYKVTADDKTIPMIVCKEWVDEVLVVTSPNKSISEQLMNKLLETGVTLHVSLMPIGRIEGKKQFVEKIGSYQVLTVALNYASPMNLFLKRCMDILAGLLGCLITIILMVIIGPMIYIASPGPIFFAQERVGQNGKHFKMYKFRSMYLDAEKRKAELLKQNRISDGRMFKLDFDPRIIGNKILPDGTHKTGIGQFIRDTSLDEFPQFFNVLKGDMSLVGTRPPTVDETELYELHHYARLAVKPGITGMWQVSGRSEITDFEEVVRLDKEYITTWNIGLDIKIILKTIGVVFKKEGSM